MEIALVMGMLVIRQNCHLIRFRDASRRVLLSLFFFKNSFDVWGLCRISQTNTPATFQQLMETCLRDLNLNWCIIYLDDIAIFLKDLASHLKNLEAMFQKLEQACLKLKSSKCELFCRQITYLVHIISSQRIVTYEGKIDAIKKWFTSTTITKVQNSLGFMGYYHWFIPNFTQVAQPLHELMSSENTGKKWVAITWNNRCQWSFDDLKHLFSMSPILACANFSRPAHQHLWIWSQGCPLPGLWWQGQCHHQLCQ